MASPRVTLILLTVVLLGFSLYALYPVLLHAPLPPALQERLHFLLAH